MRGGVIVFDESGQQVYLHGGFGLILINDKAVRLLSSATAWVEKGFEMAEELGLDVHVWVHSHPHHRQNATQTPSTPDQHATSQWGPGLIVTLENVYVFQSIFTIAIPVEDFFPQLGEPSSGEPSSDGPTQESDIPGHPDNPDTHK